MASNCASSDSRSSLVAGRDGPDGGRHWTLLGAGGLPFRSPVPGALGGHRRGKRYGRLDCPAALRALARGGYAPHRVFFADEAVAIAAGYRPCAACLPARYASWKAQREHNAEPPRGNVARTCASPTPEGMSR